MKSTLAGLGLVSILLLGSGCATVHETGSSQGSGNASDADGSSDAGNEAEGDSADTPLSAAQACFPGAWTLDLESYRQSVADVGQIQNVSGVVTVTFAEEGTVTTTYDDWSYDIIVESDVDASDATVRNGVDTGTYEISADGTATITDTSVDSEEKITSTRYSQTVTTTENTGYSMFRTAPLNCDGDEITVTVRDDRTATLNRA